MIREQRQLATSPIVSDFLRHKMTVWVCRHTFGLLSDCLAEKKLTLMLHVLYHYVDVQVFDGNPRSQPRQPSGAEAAQTAASQSGPSALWGELPDARAAERDQRVQKQGGEAGGCAERQEGAGGSSAASGDGAQEPSSAENGAAPAEPTNQTSVKQEAAAGEATSPSAAAADAETGVSRGDGTSGTKKQRAKLPQVDEMTDESYIRTLDFLRRKVAQTDTSLPSVCCYTFRNTHNTLNTLALERTGRAAVVRPNFTHLWVPV